MFSRIFVALPLALLVAANAHLEARDQCNTGAIQCCQSLQQADQSASLVQKCGLTVAEAAAQGLVGVNCSPLTVVGTGSGCQASAQTACCKNVYFNGGVNIGCSAINVNA
ncbi:hydrophobin-3 precursor [Pisolithus croceorrhizus]|nr:hydrophobin-3 precursor [Pisolithus croceorrhizus]KAI6127975.1 hydrophobin-3 precursor [Pisolithus croceorrhizus]KAI6158579.1 hydrophobin-3 precursor [Pisolithus thermaeus]